MHLYYTPKCQTDDAGMFLLECSTHLESLAKIVCNLPNANCYLGECDECPGIPSTLTNEKIQGFVICFLDAQWWLACVLDVTDHNQVCWRF